MITGVSKKAIVTKDVVRIRDEELAYKLMPKEQKLRVHEDKIMMLNISRMTPKNAAYYETRKAEIKQRRSRHSSATQ